MKSYKFTNRKTGLDYFVRIYPNLGSYTIVTPDGMEHEVGSFEKRQMKLKNGKLSRDKNAVFYLLTPWGDRTISDHNLEDAALAALNTYIFSRKVL